ncbi:MAG TPA: hypothetical protein RMH99_16975 [Sandaracinaceae bacterium LLY-WYZ-13_1]|nr:hypothetical protein [Sandaracinaceae bacterium LLY-WYZ-13_1]
MTEALLTQAVRVRLERGTFAAREDATILIEGSVGPASGGGFDAVIELSSADGLPLGARELHTEGACERLDAPVALVVALLVNHAIERIRLEVPSEPSPTARSTPTEPPATPASTAAPSSARVAWGSEIGLAANVAPDHLPGWSGAAVAYAGLRLRGVGSLELEVVWWPESILLLDVPPGGASTWALEVGLRICPQLWSEGPWKLSSCGGVRAGTLAVRGLGFSETREERAIVGLTVTARLTFWFARPLGVRAEVGALVPLLPRALTYGAADGTVRQAWRMAPVTPLAALSFLVAIP